jgi:hypothetical protein
MPKLSLVDRIDATICEAPSRLALVDLEEKEGILDVLEEGLSLSEALLSPLPLGDVEGDTQSANDVSLVPPHRKRSDAVVSALVVLFVGVLLAFQRTTKVSGMLLGNPLRKQVGGTLSFNIGWREPNAVKALPPRA